jgi:hypothetical protein
MRALTQIRAASDGSRPRAQRFSEQRRRNSLHAYGWLALALVVLLGTGAVIGYLLGARSDSPRAAPAQEMRSLERRLSGRIAEGLAGSSVVTSVSTARIARQREVWT